MDNTTINVTDLRHHYYWAGGFRVYGNKVASLAIAKYEGASGDLFVSSLTLFFTLNINTTKVQVFYGRTVDESFDTSHSKGTPFVLTIWVKDFTSWKR
jgi:hypothetical protein